MLSYSMIIVSLLTPLTQEQSKAQHVARNPFFGTFHKVNIRRNSDTFLSEPQWQDPVEHYFRYQFTVRM